MATKRITCMECGYQQDVDALSTRYGRCPQCFTASFECTATGGCPLCADPTSDHAFAQLELRHDRNMEHLAIYRGHFELP